MVTRKKEIKGKKVAKTVQGASDPFASTVEEMPAKKRTVKKVTPVSTGKAKLASKTTQKVELACSGDPFLEVVGATSSVKKTVKAKVKAAKTTIVKTPKISLDATAEIAANEPVVEVSPAFKILADPKLPKLERENRARLQMQTPTRIYFYWSVRENPYQMLSKAFGDDLGSYTLVVKLINLTRDTEEIHHAEAEGSWWFDVEPNSQYQAEIGFYAPNRPYFRIVYSNKLDTPRRNPSPRAASESDWRVSANKFAEVLDVAGFSQDAFDVAMAGDDVQFAEDATHAAFRQFVGNGNYDLNAMSVEDIRYALMALASGVELEALRSKVSAALFAALQANSGRLEPHQAMNALTEHFDIDEPEFSYEERGAAVFGASLVHFPRSLKDRKRVTKFAPRYSPVSSHSLR